MVSSVVCPQFWFSLWTFRTFMSLFPYKHEPVGSVDVAVIKGCTIQINLTWNTVRVTFTEVLNPLQSRLLGTIILPSTCSHSLKQLLSPSPTFCNFLFFSPLKAVQKKPLLNITRNNRLSLTLCNMPL